MHDCTINLDNYINKQHIKDSINVKTPYKVKEVKINDEIKDGKLCTKIEFIKDSDYHNQQIKERYDKLSSYDRRRLEGIITKDDLKTNNLKLLFAYNI